MDFSTGTFHVDGDAPLTQGQVDSVWHNLPTTGASWVEHGNLFVQQFDGAPAFNLGPVAHGVKGASGHSKQHATKKKPAQLQREIDEVLGHAARKRKPRLARVQAETPGGYRWLRQHVRGATVNTDGSFLVTNEEAWSQSLSAAGAHEI